MGKKQLSEFLAAAADDNPSAFLDLVFKHVHGKGGYNLEEILQTAQRKDLITISENLQGKINFARELLTADPEELPQEDQSEDTMTPQDIAVELLIAVSMVARLILEETKQSPPEALYDVARLLHDNYLSNNNVRELQEEISKLCLDWWQAECQGREQLSPFLIPYLIMMALEAGTGAAVKRCHTVRTALSVFNFEDEEGIHDLKALLLRAAFAPPFLRSAEGRRFLAYLFTLQPSFVKELTAIVKNQVPAGRKSVLDAYGEIIYRAWSTATGACLYEIKHSCIQNLMEAALLASSPILASSLRRVLGGLHSQKHQPGVDATLVELYEPILFRRLNAANPAVRKNALELFIDAFPLRDPEEPNEMTDKRLTEQFAALSAALKDDVPAVRAVAVSGIGHILGTYWELIPGGATAGYVKSFATELAFDTHAPAVRAAVTEALANLIDRPLSHPLLKIVLPKLAPQLYDPSSKVRIAFVDLLLTLRSVKNLPWHNIVDVPKLLEVMAADIPAVSERIQKLLLPTYFPDAQTGPAQVAALLRSSPDAGKAFCLYLTGTTMAGHGGVAAANANISGPAVAQHCLVALVRDLTTHLIEVPLVSEVQKQQLNAAAAAGSSKCGAKKPRAKRRKCRKNDEDNAAEEEQEDDVAVSETIESWENILCGVAAVVCGMAAQITAKNLDISASKGLFPNDTLAKLLERCSSATARIAVLSIATAFASSIPGAYEIRKYCMELLAENTSAGISSGHTNRVFDLEVKAALECVFVHPMSRVTMMKSVSTALGADVEDVCQAVEEDAAAESAPQRGKKRRLESYDQLEPTQAAAMSYLARIIELDVPRTYLLTSGTLAKLLPSVDAALGARIDELLTAMDSDDADKSEGMSKAGATMLTYLKASLHLLLAASEGSNGKDGSALLEGSPADDACGQAVECIQQAFEWASQVLLKLDERATKEDLIQALSPPPAAPEKPKPVKRTKGARGKAAAAAKEEATAAAPLSPVLAVFKESFGAGETCVAIAAEAARLKALGFGNSLASSAARVAQKFVSVLKKITATIGNSSSPAALDAVIITGVSHAARLSRNLAAFSRPSSAQGGRDLEAELAQAAADAPAGALPNNTTAINTMHAELIENLMSLLCEDTNGRAVSACKSHLAGLVAAMSSEDSSNTWLAPVAALLASGMDVDDEDGSSSLDTTMNDNNNDENQQPATGGKALPSPCADILSENNDAPIVRYLLSAAKLVKACEAVAGQAAVLAKNFLSKGEIALALGAVELTQIFGFEGVTQRGKSRTGANTYIKTVEELNGVQETLEGSSDAVSKALQRKLLALFPRAPKVTFDEIFN